MVEETRNFKSGYCVIAGAPNVGKSTFLNRLLGQKISITSRKPQTTRTNILGVYHHKAAAQIIFLDTPGIHAAKDIFNKRMVEAALSSLGDADVILLIADVKSGSPEAEKQIFDILEKAKKPVIFALNKIDLVKTGSIKEMLVRWKSAFPFESAIPISSKNGLGIDRLVDALIECLPEGPPFFPEDTLTDASLRFLASEIIREKIFRLTGQEIPYSSAVTIEKFEEKENVAVIFAKIHLERDSQKGIIIGKGGKMLKKIGEIARTDIEMLLEQRVFLKLFVRVQKNWSKDSRALRKFGY